MKRISLCAVFAATLLFAAVAFGQTSPQAGQERGGWGNGHRGMMATSEQRLERMSQVLNLTSEQKHKIKPILENESKQMQTLRDDTSMSREERFSKMREIRQNTISQIKPILNPDQQKQYEDMMQNMGPGRRAGGGISNPQ